MATALDKAHITEKFLIEHDLGGLSVPERLHVYLELCRRWNVDPLSQPFAYLKFQGKVQLYPLAAFTNQLRTLNGVSITSLNRYQEGDEWVCEATATLPSGRTEMDEGRVWIKGKTGDDLCNAKLKAVTKAKRRVTLAICGWHGPDETEVETMQPSEVYTPDLGMLEQAQRSLEAN